MFGIISGDFPVIISLNIASFLCPLFSPSGTPMSYMLDLHLFLFLNLSFILSVISVFCLLCNFFRSITDFSAEVLKDAEVSQAYNCLPNTYHFDFPLHPTSRMAANEGANRIQLHYHLYQSAHKAIVRDFSSKSSHSIERCYSLLKMQKTNTCLCWTKEETEMLKATESFNSLHKAIVNQSFI